MGRALLSCLIGLVLVVPSLAAGQSETPSLEQEVAPVQGEIVQRRSALRSTANLAGELA